MGHFVLEKGPVPGSACFHGTRSHDENHTQSRIGERACPLGRGSRRWLKFYEFVLASGNNDGKIAQPGKSQEL